jgi:hypothetical protein
MRRAPNDSSRVATTQWLVCVRREFANAHEQRARRIKRRHARVERGAHAIKRRTELRSTGFVR